jgi:neopullulanase
VIKPANLEPWNTPPTPHGFKGGDLLGVTERLDYLQDLGINAIYFTPIFQSAANHRYHTHDYFHIDPLLGGDAAFDTFLAAAHRRGIRVVLDGVFNHASRGFFPFNHILENGAQSPYVNWFTIYDYPLHAYDGANPNYACWMNLPELPKLNTTNPEVRAYIFSIARYWLEKGIDGWRLDVPFEIDDDAFWKEFRQVVKGVNPNAYIVGEIPFDARRWLAGDQFDAVMNYLFTYACWNFFAGETYDEAMVGQWRHHHEFSPDTAIFAQTMETLLSQYPPEISAVQLNLLDSHDTARFLNIASGNKDALRLATLFQMTYPGAPCVYYGNEIGLTGGHDPDNRRAFPWDEASWDADLRAFFQRCIALRKAYPVLRRGDYHTLYAAQGVVAYIRRDRESAALVVLNRSTATVRPQVPVDGWLADGMTLNDVLGAEKARVNEGYLEGLTLPPYTGAVLMAG